MQLQDIQVIGTEVAIRWQDGSESFITLERLRRACPCAGCKGEVDVMGKLHIGPPQRLSAASFELKSLQPVGTYAVQPVWADGHNSGIFSYDYLRAVAEQS